jgi:putative oxidoreductase
MKQIVDLIGRILLSFIFLYEAYDTIKYFDQTRQLMTEYGLVWRQDLLLYGGTSVLVLGGLMLLTGYRASFGAFLLLLYWVPVTFIVHSFWNDPEEERRLHEIFFMKNLAITGGLLMVYVNGAGRYSIKRLFATFKVPNA